MSHTILFQPRFATLVKSGEKCQTIRPVRKRVIQVGDALSLREWSGSPYRSKQRLLRSACAVRIEQFETTGFSTVPFILVDGLALEEPDELKLAIADGFKDREDMLAWFQEVHGFPFCGVIIHWTN